MFFVPLEEELQRGEEKSRHQLGQAIFAVHDINVCTSLVPRLSDRTKVTKGWGKEKAAAQFAVHAYSVTT